MKKTISWTLVIFVFFGASHLSAQFLWHLDHTDFDGRYNYCFDAISCYHNICTVAGRLVDNDKKHVYQVFWRSTDGGISWTVQNTGFLSESDLRNVNYVSSIQQIDSLHTVAGVSELTAFLADSVSVIQTSDGGKSWSREVFPFPCLGRGLCFSDSLSGIFQVQENAGIDVGGGKNRLLTTSDGGKHWDSISVDLGNNTSENNVFCSGKGKFKVFIPPYGPIFSTTDNWNTIDTSAVIINSADDPDNRYNFTHCNFTGGDTVIAFGYYLYDTTLHPNYNDFRSLIARSSDGGKSWSTPKVFTDSLWILSVMTSLKRDTILAGGIGDHKVLMSTDHGMTWSTDSLTVDTVYNAFACNGIGFNDFGRPIAIYTYEDGDQRSIPSILIAGEIPQSRVEWSGLLSYADRIFPNPAKSILNIASVEEPKPYWIIDLLGRTVLSGMTLDHSTLTVDISSFPPGVYYVLSTGLHGKMLIGKLAVTGR